MRLGIAMMVGVLAAPASAQWMGFSDESTSLMTATFPFFGSNPEAGGNENYYDGDLGDFDGDGLPDRLLGARYGLLFNTGGGLMVPIRRYVGHLLRGDPGAGGWGEDAMALIDVDGDGDLDAISGGNGEPLSCQLNNGWRWSTLWSTGGRSALNIVPTDLEGDDDVDLLVAHSFCIERSCGGPVSFRVLVNDGAGNYTDATTSSGLGLAAGEQIVGVVSADLDDDGDFDVVSQRGTASAYYVHVGLNDGTGSFTTSTQVIHVGCSGFAQNMSLGDIDDDGDLDMAIGRCIGEPGSGDVAGPYTGGHPVVAHTLAINDGTGTFTDMSATLFDSTAWTGGGELAGGDAALADVDYDGDLDFLAFQSRADFVSHLNHHFQVYLNDGTGRMVYSNRSMEWLGRASGLGADVDLSDLDGDGSLDVWLGVGADVVRILINRHEGASGPADLPRNLRVVSEAAAGVTIGWQNPTFASNIRMYHVYRSLAPGVEDRDRELIRVVGRSRFLDQDFYGSIDRHTTTADLGDPDVSIAPSGEIRFIDRTAVPGVTYYYTVTHVGPEHDESVHTGEVAATVPRPAGADTTAPQLRIIAPTTQSWERSPRIVVTFADDSSGIDPASLSVSFDRAFGPLAAGTNLVPMAYRADGNALIAWFQPPHELPDDMIVNLNASVRDASGNMATASRQFFVTISPAIVPSPALPSASFTASATTGTAPITIDFDASASSDSDGHVMRWEWYFGDGSTALGRLRSHRFAFAGTYPVTLLVRDNEGGVATTSMTITLDGPPPPADAGMGADAGMSDAGADAGCVPDCAGRECGDDGCGGTCGTCDVDRVCGAGTCMCSGATEACGDVCTDLRVDAMNCGTCGNACAAGETCSARMCGTGPCVPDCSGRTCGGDGCGGSCGDCAAGQVCASGGVCQCEGGATGCGTECVDLRTDSNHCGACNVTCEGACMAGACVTAGSDAGMGGGGGGGCGCAVPGTGDPALPIAFIAAFFALVAWRRRL